MPLIAHRADGADTDAARLHRLDLGHELVDAAEVGEAGEELRARDRDRAFDESAVGHGAIGYPERRDE